MKALKVNSTNVGIALDAIVHLVEPVEDELNERKVDYIELMAIVTAAAFSSKGDLGIMLTAVIGADVAKLNKIMFALGYRYAKEPYEFEAVMNELRASLGTKEESNGKEE